MKVVAIGADHRGVLLRDDIKKILTKHGFSCLVFGSENKDHVVDYPDVANEVAECVNSQQADFGILICGTGIGVCMYANRKPHIRAFIADSLERVYFARRHEDANIMVFAGGYSDGHKKIDTPEHKFVEQCLIEFINTKFEGGRHNIRVEKLG